MHDDIEEDISNAHLNGKEIVKSLFMRLNDIESYHNQTMASKRETENTKNNKKTLTLKLIDFF